MSTMLCLRSKGSLCILFLIAVLAQLFIYDYVVYSSQTSKSLLEQLGLSRRTAVSRGFSPAVDLTQAQDKCECGVSNNYNGSQDAENSESKPNVTEYHIQQMLCTKRAGAISAKRQQVKQALAVPKVGIVLL